MRLTGISSLESEHKVYFDSDDARGGKRDAVINMWKIPQSQHCVPIK